ncbi:MAG: endonuclease domain-containing protein [Microbacteriaceae bacterium]|nr:endonuclease domain-containing protein [Microbacteriaceae bacterium]
MPWSVEQWWQRRQRITGLAVPSPIGRYRDAWAPFTALVEQYRPERNHDLVLSQIPPAADVYLVWVCSVGHEFVATPAEQRARPGRTRSSRSWCPVCATPSLLPLAPRWPRRHNSGDAAAPRGTRMSARRVAARHGPPAPELWRSAEVVRPGEAFRSERAPRATSAAEGRLRALIAERLDVDLSATAVRVRTPFFGRLEVWPDVIVPELAIAIELDTVGRNGDEHVGRRERADRRKDQVLAEVGWHVVRLRCRPLRPLGPDDLVVAGVSAGAVDALIDRIGDVRGPLFVSAYRREVEAGHVGGRP